MQDANQSQIASSNLTMEGIYLCSIYDHWRCQTDVIIILAFDK